MLAGVLVLALASPREHRHDRAATGLDDPAAITAQTHGINTLKHLIFIVQENRSFDHYFGTYPGADGIPTDARRIDFSVCVPDRSRARASRRT